LALLASPTTSILGWLCRAVRSPMRNRSWSSISRMVVACKSSFLRILRGREEYLFHKR
jgi:hypothetical protein